MFTCVFSLKSPGPQLLEQCKHIVNAEMAERTLAMLPPTVVVACCEVRCEAPEPSMHDHPLQSTQRTERKRVALSRFGGTLLQLGFPDAMFPNHLFLAFSFFPCFFFPFKEFLAF